MRIERGPLRGIEGALIREKNSFQLVIGVELLQRSIAVQLDADFVVPINPVVYRTALAGTSGARR